MLLLHQSGWSWNQYCPKINMPRPTFRTPSSWCIHTWCFRFSFCFAVVRKPSLASLKEIHACWNIWSGELGCSHYFMAWAWWFQDIKKGMIQIPKKKKKRMSHMDLIIPAIKNIPPKKGRTDLWRLDYFSLGEKNVARQAYMVIKETIHPITIL